jgi:type II secretory pathway pseudopilin PulG
VKRSGLTLVEIPIVLVLTGILIAAVGGVCSYVSRQSARISAESEAFRSVLIATEAIRNDATRSTFRNLDADVRLQPDRRGVSMRVHRMGREIWRLELETVSYYLEPVPGSLDVYYLVRHDASGPHRLAGCLLRDMMMQVLGGSAEGSAQAYLEVTLIGAGQECTSGHYTSVILVPLAELILPEHYYGAGER